MTATRVRVQLSVWLAIAAALAYACRNSISVAEKAIRTDLGISEDAMGFILGPAFFWSYALAQIPGGWLGQRFGSRRTLPGLATVWSAATILMCCASGTASLLLGRVLGGIAQAGLFPCSALCISKWNPQVERARASGFLGAAMSVGGGRWRRDYRTIAGAHQLALDLCGVRCARIPLGGRLLSMVPRNT